MSAKTEIVLKSNEINKPYEVRVGQKVGITLDGEVIESFEVPDIPGLQKSVLDTSLCIRSYLYMEDVPAECAKDLIISNKVEQVNQTDDGAIEARKTVEPIVKEPIIPKLP